MKHFTTAVLVFSFALVISIPTSAHADHDASTNLSGGAGVNATSLEKRLEALSKMIEDLKKRIEGLKNGIPSPRERDDDDSNNSRPRYCDTVRSLGNAERGMSGGGIRNLQSFLVDEGRLPADSVTGYFGNATHDALKRWQTENGVVAPGDQYGGYFGSRTRDAIARRCNSTATTTPTTGTFMLVPKEGFAPLTVTLAGIPSAVLAKVNGCKDSVGWHGRSGNGLTIDWGDGTESPSGTSTATGASCAREMRQHTYKEPGTYTVKIKSWHPGPTDAPVTDWEATAKVEVKEKPERDAPRPGLLKISAATKAKLTLAKKLDVRTSKVTVTDVEAKEWSDGCLGLGGPAESCIAATTMGYRVTLEHDDETYYARTNKTGSTVRFEE